MNLSWWKMTKLCHEMKKNLFSFMAAKFQKTHLAWSTVQMRTIDDLTEDTCHEGDRVQTRYFPAKTQLIYYPRLSGTLNISINAESFWVQCPTFITPPGLMSNFHYSPGFTWASLRLTGRVSLGFPDTKSVVSLETTCNSSKHPLGVQQGNLILTANPWS